mgnify:FL=1
MYATYTAKPPGIVLGQYEGLLAIIAWVREALLESKYKYGPVRSLAVSPKMTEQLLVAYLLYGSFDAIASMRLFDHFIRGRGFIQSRRELVGDFLFSSESWSPFSHSLESGFAWPIGQLPPRMGPLDKTTILSSCVRGVRRAGVVSCTRQEPDASPIPVQERLRESIDTLAYWDEKGLMPNSPLEADSTVLRLIYAIERSIDLEIPFFSRDAAAPAWIRTDSCSDCHILRLVFDEVNWLPKPRTFKEAYSMAQDERLVGLRAYVRQLAERSAVGDLKQHDDITEQIRKDVSAFRSKPWAARIAQFVAYAAVPAEIAGLLCH